MVNIESVSVEDFSQQDIYLACEYASKKRWRSILESLHQKRRNEAELNKYFPDKRRQQVRGQLIYLQKAGLVDYADEELRQSGIEHSDTAKYELTNLGELLLQFGPAQGKKLLMTPQSTHGQSSLWDYASTVHSD